MRIPDRGRLPAWAAILSVLPFLLLVAGHWSDGPVRDADDYAHYLMHAKAVAEGRPYSDIGYIYTPYNPWIGPATQPPGLPLTLAPVLAAIGPNEHVLKLLMLAFGLAFLLLVGRYFALHDDLLVGVVVVVLTGLSANILAFATQVQTDLPFAAFVWAVIYLYDRPGPWRSRRLILVSLVGACALLQRSAGLALIPAAALSTLVRFREHKFVPAIPVVVWSALLLIVATLWRPPGFTTQILPDDLRQVAGFLWRNVIEYRFALFESHLYPFSSDRMNDVFHVVSAAVMAVGLLTWLRTAYSRFLVAFAVVYTAALLVLPVHDTRYFWPLFPLSSFGLLIGVRTLVRLAIPSFDRRRATGVAVAAGLAIALAVVIVPGRPRLPAFTKEPDVQALFAHLGRTSATNLARVVFIKPRVLAWVTGIPAMGFPVAEPGVVLDELRRRCITHVIVGDVGMVEPGIREVNDTIAMHPEAFALDYRNGSFSVYRFAGSDPDRCALAGPRRPQGAPRQ